jgi:pimeloyl-ACP methyl ester carboxylesterase
LYINDISTINKLKLDISILNNKKITLNIGDTNGYYFNGQVNYDANYTCMYIDSVDNIDYISFECLQNNAGIIYFVYDDDTKERFGYDVGTYNIKVPDNVKTIWINFWTTSFVNGVTLHTNLFLPYQDGYIYKTFEVPKYSDLSSERNNNTACLKLPLSYTSKGIPTKLVIICHGASMGINSNGTGWTNDSGYNRLVDNLINQGYAIMDSNGYDDSTSSGHEHWSCPQALSGYIKAYDYFTQNYNLDKNVYLYGFSMGGLTALNLAINRSIPIRCIMVGAPVISLYNQCVERGLNYDFLLAYGMGGTYDADKCKGYDRFLDIININNIDYVLKDLPPIRCAYGVDDTAISNANIIQYFNSLRNSNKNAIVKGYEGGHDISYGGSLAVIYDIINYFYYY